MHCEPSCRWRCDTVVKKAKPHGCRGQWVLEYHPMREPPCSAYFLLGRRGLLYMRFLFLARMVSAPCVSTQSRFAKARLPTPARTRPELRTIAVQTIWQSCDDTFGCGGSGGLGVGVCVVAVVAAFFWCCCRCGVCIWCCVCCGRRCRHPQSLLRWRLLLQLVRGVWLRPRV